MHDSTGFYSALPAVSTFASVTEEDRYTPLPDDWLIVLSDIKGSTAAIRKGAYKTVNMVGAASIMSILNISRGIDIPYVFGGDGGTLAIPAVLRAEAEKALIQVRALARKSFSLDLRIGMIPVTEIRKAGVSVKVLKYEIGEGLFLGMFSGGGLMEADRLLKQDHITNPYRIPDNRSPESPPDLEGLSCRWEPLQARNGRMVSLLVSAPTHSPKEKARIYEDILTMLRAALGTEPEKYRPTSNDNLRFRWPPRSLWTEAKLTAGKHPVFRRWCRLAFQSFVQVFLEKTGRKAGNYDAPLYRKELLANTDFRRFDDMIRLVLDCTPEQITSIRRSLQSRHDRGDIVFGLHEADSALMTCLVFNLAEGAHLHFVDGSNGGFALAAAELKQQLAARLQGNRGLGPGDPAPAQQAVSIIHDAGLPR